MCECVCVWVYIYIYIYVYMCVCMYTHVIGMEVTKSNTSYICVSVRVCVNVYICVYICMCVYVFIHMRVIYICTHTRTHAQAIGMEVTSQTPAVWWVYGITHSYVWRDSFICVTWLIHMYDVTHWNMWHNLFVWYERRSPSQTPTMCWVIDSFIFTMCGSFIRATWLIDMCDITHSFDTKDGYQVKRHLCVEWPSQTLHGGEDP